MHLPGSVPWSIRFDTPKELLFLGYIGMRETFQVREVAEPSSSIEADWQAWWQFLLAHNFSTITDEVRHENPSQSGIPYLREVGTRYRAIYDPPQFSVLADRPVLHALCLRYWPDYHSEWESADGSGIPFFSLMSERIAKLGAKLGLAELVRACVRDSGKRLVPFALSFDFLYWPADYEKHLSATHITLGSRYLEDEQVAPLRRVVSDTIISTLD